MIYLVEYDRAAGTVVRVEEYRDSNREAAKRARLARERDLNRAAIAHELVMLEATDWHELVLTHGRYFQYSRRAAEVSAAAV